MREAFWKFCKQGGILIYLHIKNAPFEDFETWNKDPIQILQNTIKRKNFEKA